MRVTLAEPAERDLDNIVDYIAADNPSAAQNVYRKIMATARHLADFPALGRSGWLPNTRELVVAGLPYLVVYRVQADTVTVLAIGHTARDIVRLLNERNEKGQAS